MRETILSEAYEKQNVLFNIFCIFRKAQICSFSLLLLSLVWAGEGKINFESSFKGKLG